MNQTLDDIQRGILSMELETYKKVCANLTVVVKTQQLLMVNLLETNDKLKQEIETLHELNSWLKTETTLAKAQIK